MAKGVCSTMAWGIPGRSGIARKSGRCGARWCHGPWGSLRETPPLDRCRRSRIRGEVEGNRGDAVMGSLRLQSPQLASALVVVDLMTGRTARAQATPSAGGAVDFDAS